MRRVWLGALCNLVLVSVAAAQSNVEVNAGVQFDFQSPGARSLAMGSAFIGVADDATAAFVNPAGLRALSRREISFEGRGRNVTIPIVTGGRANGTPTRTTIGGVTYDTNPTLVIENQDQSGIGLSFLSFIYPRSRWSVAGYRHELANLETNVKTQGFFFSDANGGPLRRVPIDGNLDLEIVTYGVSGSFNVTSTFSVGVGLGYHDFTLKSLTNRFTTLNPAYTNPVFFGAPNYSQDNLSNVQRQNGDDTAIGVNAGAIWAPSRLFQVGVVYRQGPEFELDFSTQFINAAAREFDGKFKVPHVFGVGGVFRPMANGTLAVDVTNVQYSRLSEEFVDFTQTSPATYFVKDATEVHVGFEYVLTGRVPIALRGGYWFDPEHALEVEGAVLPDSDQFVFKASGEDQQHVTFGGGVVFGRYEINAAGDISDRSKLFSLSAVLRF